MKLTTVEVEILIMESVVDRSAEHSARMKRRMFNAEVEYSDALADEQKMRRTLRDLREAWLAGTVLEGK